MGGEHGRAGVGFKNSSVCSGVLTNHVPPFQPLYCMPECAEVMKMQKCYGSSDSSYDSSGSSSNSDLDENDKELCQKRLDQVPYSFKHSKLFQQSSKSISPTLVEEEL